MRGGGGLLVGRGAETGVAAVTGRARGSPAAWHAQPPVGRSTSHRDLSGAQPQRAQRGQVLRNFGRHAAVGRHVHVCRWRIAAGGRRRRVATHLRQQMSHAPRGDHFCRADNAAGRGWRRPGRSRAHPGCRAFERRTGCWAQRGTAWHSSQRRQGALASAPPMAPSNATSCGRRSAREPPEEAPPTYTGAEAGRPTTVGSSFTAAATACASSAHCNASGGQGRAGRELGGWVAG